MNKRNPRGDEQPAHFQTILLSSLDMTGNRMVRAYTRHYRDSGQETTYIEWVDQLGRHSRTEGDPKSYHMQALLRRACREGIEHTKEVW